MSEREKKSERVEVKKGAKEKERQEERKKEGWKKREITSILLFSLSFLRCVNLIIFVWLFSFKNKIN